jgi:hypothetical protein
MISLTVATLALAATAAQVPADTPAQGRNAIRPVSQCLDPARVRSWQPLDSFRVIVDAGRRRYLVETAAHCTAIAIGTEVTFKGDLANRLCGDTAEFIESGATRCRVSQVLPLTKQQYEDLLKPPVERKP